MPDRPIVALSGYLDDENRARALAIGFDLCVTKGGEFADFRRQVDALVKRRAEKRLPTTEALASADSASPIST